MSDKGDMPAFPTEDVHYPNGQIQFGSTGMTLRQWYAGQALVGAIAEGAERQRGRRGRAAELAEFAWMCADAMLAEKEQTK